MPAKGKPTKQNRKASREQARARRRARVWNLFMAGTPKSTIAALVDCAPQTVTNDIEETTQERKELEPLYAADIRDRAIGARRHLQSLSLEASAETEPKERAPLLKEARHNQTGIEVLQDLHPKEPAVIGVGPTFIQIGDGPPEDPGELTREEREERRRIIDAELEALPASADDAEYTPVEEPGPDSA